MSSSDILTTSDLAEKAFRLMKVHTCCERHWNRRPEKLETYDESLYPDSGRSQGEVDALLEKCACSCRHDLRFLCRFFGLYDSERTWNRDWIIGLIQKYSE